MPEIAEVENARRKCHLNCVGRKIVKVEVQPDPIVFAGKEPADIVKVLENKKVVDTKRWGKYFVLSKYKQYSWYIFSMLNEKQYICTPNGLINIVLDKGPHLVCHFGMTGTLKFKHNVDNLQLHNDKQAKDSTWPPRFYKILLTLKGPQDKSPMDMALTDSRRLGRIRLVGGDPLKSEPISKLGFDPILNLPNEDTFTALVQKRAMPIKALLLDQSFSAQFTYTKTLKFGVGNWVADEILYHSHIHPAQYANTLSTAQCHTLHQNMEYVCRTAVEADADSSLFPDNWIMNYRWKKGKGKGNGVLPNGQVMAFETVGGRTSCFVPEVQVLPESQKTKSEVKTKVKKRPIKEENDQITECIKKDGMSRAERYIKRAKTKANSLSV
ncbi:hypothetical protein PHYBLDRAFT_66028 [Phycomyces blakesleeanus NRRL 1555(-)]|uniref:Formamidopyrimidine-DNA glycosylase catalytic domain-containing protein n=1 Tax=Phycomyces blakesleeanus (strain ATCC 8743b / DSM 1359 / FGSC 10004 / NBRC 33097 / NRRL 1555) TaxID=763407 RepID=A0A162PJC2_PHYB8|nr:hypothetical protein PHYBLDRAFT_66028 [Phycomyces blakesleeanus NRRL 1555(-)]OAD73417.1 hypothetical protein PHYBLDRAFT_66028 [Phycomyces blakesleeanus NRRL 1555(-)]|eukprot:XP_018291457.1 hypothetical protein PHYBLDRAFT_66028 [Phycomyces blakesleeanus NRRL 1555(-)]